MSVLLFPPPALDDPGWLTALGAVAVAEVVAEQQGLDAKIKWPNDVRVDGKKLAGVLVERGQGAVLGIGVNVNVPQFPEPLDQTATSLQILKGEPVDRSEFVRSLIERLDHLHQRATEQGPHSLNEFYLRRSEHLHRQVEVDTTEGRRVGRLVGIDLLEGLVLEADTRQAIPRETVRGITCLE